MKRSSNYRPFGWLIILALLVGCAAPMAAAPTSAPPSPTEDPTLSATAIPPTETAIPPTATAQPTPTATALPGRETYPISELGTGIPWLRSDSSRVPTIEFLGFKTNKPPFNNPNVRKAFAAALDRAVIMELYNKYYPERKAYPATVLTPPNILGRDLNGEVGIGYDVAMAKQYLEAGGFPGGANFPKVLLVVNYAPSAKIPAFRYKIAEEMARMWQEALGIEVQVKAYPNWKDYNTALKTDTPDMFWYGWQADMLDPDNFLRELFATGAGSNRSNFSDPTFDGMMKDAAANKIPSMRQVIYIEAERYLCEIVTALFPLAYFDSQ